MEENSLVALTEEYLMSKIYVIRGVQVILEVQKLHLKLGRRIVTYSLITEHQTK